MNGVTGTAVVGVQVSLGSSSRNATGSFDFAVAQIGTKTSWQPVKDLTFSAEFLYSRLEQNLNGIYVGNIPGKVNGTVYTLGNQNLYNGAVQVLRSF